jgi:hypothetical protein
MTNAPIGEAIYQITFWRNIFNEFHRWIQEEVRTENPNFQAVDEARDGLVKAGLTILKYWDTVESEIGDSPFDQNHKENLSQSLRIPSIRVITNNNHNIIQAVKEGRLFR